VRSPLSDGVVPPVFEEVHPEWTVDVFLMKQTASFVEFARFQPPHRPPKDRFIMKNGMLDGWVMDKKYVEECIAKAISVPKKNQFSLSRY